MAGSSDTAHILFSSGTTGKPGEKHRHCAQTTWQHASSTFAGYRPGACHMLLLPHPAATCCCTLHVLCRRAQGHPMEPCDPPALRCQCFLPPRCAAGRRGLLAHQPGLDAGPLAGVCRWGRWGCGARCVLRCARWLEPLCPSRAMPTVCLPRLPACLPAALLNGATIALFQGSPQGRPFGAFVQAAGVTMLGVVPSIVKVGGRVPTLHAAAWADAMLTAGLNCWHDTRG